MPHKRSQYKLIERSNKTRTIFPGVTQTSDIADNERANNMLHAKYCQSNCMGSNRGDIYGKTKENSIVEFISVDFSTDRNKVYHESSGDTLTSKEVQETYGHVQTYYSEGRRVYQDLKELEELE